MNRMDKYLETKFRDTNILNRAFAESASIIKRNYLNELTSYQVEDVPKTIAEKKIARLSRFYSIEKLVYNRKENFIENLTTVARAAHISNCSIVTVIAGNGEQTHFWVGMVNKANDESLTDDYTRAIEDAISGNFQGSRIECIKNEPVEKELENFDKYKVVSAVSNIASLRDEEGDMDSYVQGIDKLVDALRGKCYTILTIADPIDNRESALVQNSLEQLYSQLSGFAKTEMAINENENTTDSESNAKGFSKALGTNTSTSQSHTSQTGWSDSDSQSEGRSRNPGAAVAAVASVAAVGLTVATGGAAAALVAAGVSMAVAAVGTENETKTLTNVKSGSDSDSRTHTLGESRIKTTSNTTTSGTSRSRGTGKTLTISVENRAVKSVLDSIDMQMERLRECGSYGSFSSCTYILTNDIATNMSASSMFAALVSGKNSNIQSTKVNTWGLGVSENDGEDVAKILSYLAKLTHPRFANSQKVMKFTPASLVSGRELAIQLGFPKKSIQGVSVVYKVPFGRNVIRNKQIKKSLAIGKLYHMGMTDKKTVDIDLEDLTSHLFITGSTGTGKSNTVYKLLEQIHKMDENVHFMVIEPAKGEYKHEFYKHPTIKTEVYGTNPKKANLIRINPFSFPEDIHVLEHIDRLVEIMNVCWPMYAAMPAILKNAVIKSYEACGWDMTNSECRGQERCYPGFADVLKNINFILESSAFSQDNKGDYTGALCTRVESLMTGINGMIFGSDELDFGELVNQNVIVDLSRLGAVETKSLIMGILVMKLQEYRLSEELTPNQEIRHIMVLEEAHNLLKKTSTEQSAESGNLMGKSVEMITNAIAEMRTYGEGFFIVDQAPNLLDTAVIRNTNTKIVLRLPEQEDREAVGSAMALSDEQILELSKLEFGCAVVYQNDWEEAVVCRFDQYLRHYELPGNDKQNTELFQYSGQKHIKSPSELKKDVLCFLLDLAIREPGKGEMDQVEQILEEVRSLAISQDLKRRLREIVTGQQKDGLKTIAPAVVELYGCKNIIERINGINDIEEWNAKILELVDPELQQMEKCYKVLFVQCVLIEQSMRKPEFKPHVETWIQKMKEMR